MRLAMTGSAGPSKTTRRRPRPVEAKVPKTKTFNGCWTCRRRKVKCDNTRPKCLRCARDYDCEGYDVELFWIGETDDEPGPSHVKHKAMVVRDDAIPRSCNLEELQDMIGRLDEAELETENARIGPFSIFTFKTEIPEPHLDPVEDVEFAFHDISPEASFSNIGSSFVFEVETPILSDGDLLNPSTSYDSERSSIIDGMFSDGSFLDDDVELIERDPRPLSLWSESSPLDFELRSVVYNDKTIGLLMHNYVTNIADLLQPAHHPRNPYKSIYMPNALIGSANLLSGMGNFTSDRSSNIAIFHALLSVSAFHLRGTRYTENQMMFEQLGRFHRAQALQNLSKALRNESEDRYATMAAMLSLVTSDLMEGGMTEFWIHLEGCNRLRTSAPSDSGLDSQHKQLQTVCLFMTILAKSTNPETDNLPWPFNDGDDVGPLNYLASPFDPTDSSLEFIYGITATLASFVHLITKLSQHTLYYTSQLLPLPRSLAVACDSLGKQIFSWSLEYELLLSVDRATEPSTLALIRHHTLAFHSAIRIMFHTRISFSLSPCDPYILAIYSRDTLSHLRQMEEIKTRHAGHAGWKPMAPIVWPGFVAACEAADEDRDAWRAWWTGVQSYRIGSISTMWWLVQEVWAERDRGAVGVALWVDVSRRRGQRVISGG